MIKNYFTIALRNIKRNFSFTLINIAGLSLGITCSIVLFLLITFLTSFDNYHPEGNRIYRIVHANKHNDREDHTAGVPVPLPDAVRSDLSGIDMVLFIAGRDGGLVSIERNGDKDIFEEEQGFAYTDENYFKFFRQGLIEGSNQLKNPNEAVIAETLARKYFGNENPIGKTIRLDNEKDIRIIGLMEDHPANTNFPFDLLISFETVRQAKEEGGWGSVSSDDQCLVMLSEGVKPETVNAQFPDFLRKYRDPESHREWTTWLQPLNEVHHDPRFSNYSFRAIERGSLWAMGVIAVFLLTTACINFINLTTAVAVKRSKEVGIRKVLGSKRKQLIIQYLSETGIITLFALVLSVGLAELSLMQLNAFLELDLHINFDDGHLALFLLSVWFVVSITSGLYPAFLMSGFTPALALKNKITNRSSSSYLLRRGLVVFQFVISQFLIVGTIILLSQMEYFNSKDLGFTREAVITIPIPERDDVNKKRSLRNAVERVPGVEKVSLCFTPPSSGSVSITDFEIDGVEGDYLTHVKILDDRYIDLFDIPIIAGRGLSPIDTVHAWIVNEKLVKLLGLTPEDVIGRNLELWDMTRPVVGVVRDFHTTSLEREIDPVILFSNISYYRTLAVRLEGGELNKAIGHIQQAWEAQYPDFLFSYEFLDQEIAEFYDGTKRMSTLLIIFSVIAVIIGCLGLYGLISFMANQKEKEIGVRKALGATTAQIMGLFSKEFFVLIVIAFALASPLAAYIMNLWLENFAYRIEVGWPMFLGGIMVTIAIAFLTVGHRSLRAAQTNPADVLRSE